MTKREHDKIRLKLRSFLARAGSGVQQAMGESPEIGLCSAYIGKYAKGERTISTRAAVRLRKFLASNDPYEFIANTGIRTPIASVDMPAMPPERKEVPPERKEVPFGDTVFKYCHKCDAITAGEMCGRPIPFCGFCGSKLKPDVAPPRARKKTGKSKKCA